VLGVEVFKTGVAITSREYSAGIGGLILVLFFFVWGGEYYWRCGKDIRGDAAYERCCARHREKKHGGRGVSDGGRRCVITCKRRERFRGKRAEKPSRSKTGSTTFSHEQIRKFKKKRDQASPGAKGIEFALANEVYHFSKERMRRRVFKDR